MIYLKSDLASPKQTVLLERHPTVHIANSRQDMAAIFITRGTKRLPFPGGTDLRVAHQLLGKPEAGEWAST